MIRLERILLACLSMLLVLSSCSVKEVEPSFDGGRIEQIVAAVEHHSSKTSLAGNRRTVLWSPGDAINVFYGSSSAKFVSVNSEPEDVTLFRSPDTYIAGGSEGSSKYIWAVYPYSSDNKSDGMSVTMTVPSKQLAREGTFADKSFPSVGRSKNTNVAFYNLCGGISFTLSRSDVRRVVFRSSNGASLCGKVKVIFDAEGYPCVSDYLDPCDSVVLATNGESFMADSTYYLACLPAALDGGFTIDLYTNGMKGTRSSAKSNVIKRSVFGNLGVIDRGVEFSEFHGVIADFIEAVDLGLSVKWAPFNVGAANSEQLGDLFAWGETRTKAVFEWQNYKWAFIENSPYSFWNAILKLEDDAARTNWGGAWRMATDSELRELENNCDVKNVTLNGVHGLQYTSKINGNSIFFPLFIIDGHPCATWTSSRWRFLTSDYDVSLERAYGLPVRPVLSNQIKSIKIAQDKLVTGQHDSLVLAFSVTPETGIHEEYVWTSSNPEVAEVDVYGTIRTKAAGEALITVTAVDGGASASCAITVKAVSVPEMVDLGLSVKWASFNIGAKSPEGSGDLFAWGETEPYYITGEADKDHPVWKPGKESGYVRANYKWYDPTSSYYSKYTSKDYSLAGDDKYILDPEDDAATQLLGENWRMPTYAELQELLSNCSREPVTINGVEGYKFTSRMTGYTDKWIFIPYSGNRIGLETTSSDQFWTSNTDGRNYAYTRYGTYDRYYGLPVRPVSGGKPVIPVKGIYIDDSAITLPLGSQSSLRVRYSPIYTTERSVIWASDNERVAVVSQDGLVTAVAAGTAVITVSTPDLSMRVSCNVTVIPTSNDSLVDLGLSVKWASCNLGASKPEEGGDYYAWGETDPYYEPGQARESSPTWKQGKSEGYTWESYKWCNGSNTSFTKYCLYPEDGTVDHQYLLLPEDDAAAVILGGDWRMPTYDEAMELVEKCSWSSATVNGTDGYIVSSLIQGYEGRYIFMPRSGHRYKGILYRFGEAAHFYVKNPRYDGSVIEAYGRSLSYSSAFISASAYQRCVGLQIRPVCGKITPVSRISLDANQLSLLQEESQQLHPTIFPENASDKNISWSSNDTTIASVDSEGVVTGKKTGQAVITAYSGDGKVMAYCIVTVADFAPAAVDLGLSVKWRNCNLGSETLSDSGSYYYWGVTSPRSEDVNEERDMNLSSGVMNKYSSNNYSSLQLEDDAARKELGADWRVPTIEEWTELATECEWIPAVCNGRKGYKVYGKKAGYTDNWVFISCCGSWFYSDGDKPRTSVSNGYYMASDVDLSRSAFKGIQVRYYQSMTNNSFYPASIYTTTPRAIPIRPVTK